MKEIARIWKSLKNDDRGATAIEYSLIAAMLGIALIPVISDTSSGIASLYARIPGYFAKFN